MERSRLLHKTHNDLPAETRIKIIELLNQQLADAADLASQIKQAHWNVKGMQFIALHELFDQFAADVYAYVDMLAERITTLGGVAMGTTRLAALNSRLPEIAYDLVDGASFVTAIAERMAQFSATSRAAIDQADADGDMVTADLLTEITRGNDKNLWFLEAHIQS